jgi:hypothetical protein
MVMNTLTILPTALAELSVGQLADLDSEQLRELDGHLDELIAWARKARAKLDAALDQRFGAPAREALRESGRDFGTAHIIDGSLRVTFELPKKVSWDQKQLAAMAARIAATGDRVGDYIDVKYSVSESRYKNWPATLQQQFASARTVEAGKPTFTLTLADGGAE